MEPWGTLRILFGKIGEMPSFRRPYHPCFVGELGGGGGGGGKHLHLDPAGGPSISHRSLYMGGFLVGNPYKWQKIDI